MMEEVTGADLLHLRRCVKLATEAVAAPAPLRQAGDGGR